MGRSGPGAPSASAKSPASSGPPQGCGEAGYRKLRLPSWAVEMLRRRQAEAEPNGWNVVFTSPTGLLRDPSNTQAGLRDVFGRVGYPWVTSHVFRKTAATLLDEAVVTARKIADALAINANDDSPDESRNPIMGVKWG